MSSMTIKVRDGVKTFLDKGKSRSVPLHLGSIMKCDADSCEDNVVAGQSIDLPWFIPKDYNMNDETRLLAYGNALEETLINSTRYDLDNEGKYIEMGYSTHLELQPSSGLNGFYDNIVECVIIQKCKREEIRKMAGINIDDFQVYDDGGVYKIFEQTLNLKYNINSYNVLCVMEMYRHRPEYIFNDIITNR
ncbi:hypothetical protein FQA39_LY14932 [Lamprigera yunnana]|nr:hypothetical protein FQA39_LY14932 [Lamprigera yunnana]